MQNKFATTIHHCPFTGTNYAKSQKGQQTSGDLVNERSFFPRAAEKTGCSR